MPLVKVPRQGGRGRVFETLARLPNSTTSSAISEGGDEPNLKVYTRSLQTKHEMSGWFAGVSKTSTPATLPRKMFYWSAILKLNGCHWSPRDRSRSRFAWTAHGVPL